LIIKVLLQYKYFIVFSPQFIVVADFFHALYLCLKIHPEWKNDYFPKRNVHQRIASSTFKGEGIILRRVISHSEEKKKNLLEYEFPSQLQKHELQTEKSDFIVRFFFIRIFCCDFFA